MLAVSAAVFQEPNPVRFSDFAFTPELGRKFEPLEVTFSLNRKFKNPFDTREIDVSLLVSGPGDLHSMQYGFYWQGFNVVTEENGSTSLTPIGEPTWKMRFAPWASGGFSILPIAFDEVKRYESRRISVRAADSTSPAFPSANPKESYFRIGKDAFFPTCTDLRAPRHRLNDVLKELDRAKVSGFNTVRLNLFRFAPTHLSLGRYDLASAWAIDYVLSEARVRGLHVLIVANDESELDASWKTNPYNASLGGPCDSPDQFWRSLKARIEYKKWLRYIVSRVTANSNLLGIQFFDGVATPDYWIQEMATEITALHTYGTLLSTSPGTKQVWEQKRIGFATTRIGANGDPAAAARSAAGAIDETRASTDKPILAQIRWGDGEDAGISSVWAAIVSGCAGAHIQSSSDFPKTNPVFQFVSKVSWLREARKVQDLTVEDSSFGRALMGDSGGIVVVVGRQTSVEVKLRRDRTYRVAWFDLRTGQQIEEKQVSSEKRTVRLTRPSSDLGAAAIVR